MRHQFDVRVAYIRLAGSGQARYVSIFTAKLFILVEALGTKARLCSDIAVRSRLIKSRLLQQSCRRPMRSMLKLHLYKRVGLIAIAAACRVCSGLSSVCRMTAGGSGCLAASRGCEEHITCAAEVTAPPAPRMPHAHPCRRRPALLVALQQLL